MNDLAGVRAELEARLRALSAQIDRIEEEQRAPLGDDFSDQAVAREDDEALDGIERGAMDDMARTRQAIARIDAGTTDNVIPESAELTGTLRAVSEHTRHAVWGRIRQVADGTPDVARMNVGMSQLRAMLPPTPETGEDGAHANRPAHPFVGLGRD